MHLNAASRGRFCRQKANLQKLFLIYCNIHSTMYLNRCICWVTNPKQFCTLCDEQWIFSNTLIVNHLGYSRYLIDSRCAALFSVLIFKWWICNCVENYKHKHSTSDRLHLQFICVWAGDTVWMHWEWVQLSTLQRINISGKKSRDKYWTGIVVLWSQNSLLFALLSVHS